MQQKMEDMQKQQSPPRNESTTKAVKEGDYIDYEEVK